tara:strand:- start:1038 stop:2090 length:1053 start_codon:yes stop_codon:yes gene_type:complete
MRLSPTIFVVPTGIGCQIGGFAGDALPAAKLLASASGCLVTHPNVMNGGSLSERNDKIFYVEGYSLDRFARAEIGLKKVNQQTLGIIFDSSIENDILLRHLQAADACMATLGINIAGYVMTNEPVGIIINNESSGISNGFIRNPNTLIEAGKRLIDNGITAIAIVTRFPDDIDSDYLKNYREGKGIDVIAGVEAVISHLISKYLKLPCAHAPALTPIKLKKDLDPRTAAEEIGYTFLPSVLIGLSNAPNLIDLPSQDEKITVYPDDIESIVVPDGALGGDAVLACMERDINVITVQNQGVLDVSCKWFEYKKLFKVENYFEAAGLILALREGINFKAIKRPLNSIKDFIK